jgi:hypothetical protein
MCKVNDGTQLFINDLYYEVKTVCTLFESKNTREINEKPSKDKLLTEYLIDSV